MKLKLHLNKQKQETTPPSISSERINYFPLKVDGYLPGVPKKRLLAVSVVISFSLTGVFSGTPCS